MTGKPVCPIHPWMQLKHYPDDDIRQWECPKCGWMAREDYIKNMTPELMKQIKESHDSLQRYHAEAPARAQAKRIEARMADIEKGKGERDKEQEKERKKHKNVKSITDFT